jgi:hypothetical protein
MSAGLSVPGNPVKTSLWVRVRVRLGQQKKPPKWPLAQAGSAGGDSRTGAALTTVRGIGVATRRRPVGWIGTDGRAGQCPPDGRRGAENSLSWTWPRSTAFVLAPGFGSVGGVTRTSGVHLPPFQASRARSRHPSSTRPAATSAGRSHPQAVSTAPQLSLGPMAQQWRPSLISMPPNFGRRFRTSHR